MATSRLKITLPYQYAPRSYHRRIYAALDRGCKHVLLVMHRRSGKTESILSYMPRAMLTRLGNYAHVFPMLKQAREIVWDGINHAGLRYLDHFPVPLRFGEPNKSELKMTLRNLQQPLERGSTYQLYGTDHDLNALVGGNIAGVVWDEYSLHNPLAREYARPILAENDGWEVLCLTPRGENHAYHLYQYAKEQPDWHVEYLTVHDTRRDGPGEDGGPVISDEAIAAHRRELSAQGYPGVDALIEQEYFLSWKAPMPGAYWSAELLAAEQEGRIGHAPYLNSKPVDTYWDLGISKAHDTNTIWFVQQVGTQVVVIDYHQASNEGITYFVKMLQAKPYIYRRHYTREGDLNTADWGTGKTRLETAKAHGLAFYPVPDLALIEGINAVRALLPRCYFDAQRCKDGLAALRAYRREYDQTKRMFLDHPVHNWASHASDGFRYLAVGLKDGWDGERTPRQAPQTLGMARSHHWAG